MQRMQQFRLEDDEIQKCLLACIEDQTGFKTAGMSIKITETSDGKMVAYTNTATEEILPK